MSKKSIFLCLLLLLSLSLSACSLDQLSHWLGSQSESETQTTTIRKRPQKETTQTSLESTSSQEQTTAFQSEPKVAQKAIDATLLEPNQDYFFDLDGDGQQEKIHYSHGDDWDTDVVLMVDDVEVYRRQMRGFGALYSIADLDVQEKGLHLLLGDHIENYAITYTEFQRYQQGQVAVVATSDDNRALECFGTVEITDETGDGTFYMLSNQHNAFIGSFYIKIPYFYHQGQIDALPTEAFSLADYSLDYGYELKAPVPLYQDSSQDSEIIHTLEAGDTITIQKIIPVNHRYCQEGPRELIDDEASDEHAVYVYVVDQAGREGWLFLDKRYSYYEDTALFYDLPTWG